MMAIHKDIHGAWNIWRIQNDAKIKLLASHGQKDANALIRWEMLTDLALLGGASLADIEPFPEAGYRAVHEQLY
jgi:hypothetical protein